MHQPFAGKPNGFVPCKVGPFLKHHLVTEDDHRQTMAAVDKFSKDPAMPLPTTTTKPTDGGVVDTAALPALLKAVGIPVTEWWRICSA